MSGYGRRADPFYGPKKAAKRTRSPRRQKAVMIDIVTPVLPYRITVEKVQIVPLAARPTPFVGVFPAGHYVNTYSVLRMWTPNQVAGYIIVISPRRQPARDEMYVTSEFSKRPRYACLYSRYIRIALAIRRRTRETP